MLQTYHITVHGRVQGVGFRPFIYALAHKYCVTGTVQNNRNNVQIFVEGTETRLQKMLNELKESPPPLSKIQEITIKEVPFIGFEEFSIIPSQSEEIHTVPFVPVDAGTCEHCLEELADPNNRRFEYPFINCTQCGPRYTIITNLPYDRPFTTMSEFAMCPLCQQEYEDPINRRHHAQPICCSTCGPTVTLKTNKGEILQEGSSAIHQTIQLIQQGNIIAVKGIGGYHLACDATQESAIRQLRLRKRRPKRPLALMVRSLDIADQYCQISPLEKKILTRFEKPIVILSKKERASLPNNISPGLSTLGIMLPYSPLHQLLFQKSNLSCLIMTSANRSGLPILYQDQYQESLSEMCDYILTHNRQIYLPIEDSVIQCNGEDLLFLRRARGYTPEPIQTNHHVDQIVALGGNQKSTFAIGKQNQIITSPQLGDLENEEMFHYFHNQLQHSRNWLGIQEQYVAIDQHPFYATTALANELQKLIIPVQHHHAHLVSCMEDNKLTSPCFGLILDGTGYGDDGNLWGFECLYGDRSSYERFAHLQYTPLPGGERAIREPWRNAVGMLLFYLGKSGKKLAKDLFPDKCHEIEIIERMIQHQIHTPLAGTCGRLFDAVSSLLGVCLTSTYEGEAAIRLSDFMVQSTGSEHEGEIYPFEIIPIEENLLQLQVSTMIQSLIQEKLQHQPIKKIIQKFHRTIVACCVQMILQASRLRPDLNRTVVLSGGSFQNIYLTKEIRRHLQAEGFTVYTHKKIPCHDGGLSVGQIIIAAESIRQSPIQSRNEERECV